MTAALEQIGSGRRVRIAAAVVVLVFTLIPMHQTRTAVAYCLLGPLMCLAVGFAVTRFRIGRVIATELETTAARIPGILLKARPFLFCVLVGAASFAFCSIGSIVLFDRLPGVVDSALYLFQAKILHSGHVVAAAPEIPEFFSSPFMLVDEGRWYSQYPPGFPAILSVGVALGAPWLVNPVLAALNAILVYRLGREIGSELEARVACLFAGFSPFIILMNSDYMSYPASLLFATGFMLAVMLAVKHGSATATALAGITGAACFATRPYTALGICLVFAGVCLVSLVRSRRYAAMFAGAIGALVPLVLFALYNLGTTGDPFLLGYSKLHGTGHTPGFGATPWGVHTIWSGFTNTLLNLNALNKDFFQLPFPALALTAMLFALGRPRAWDFALLASFVSLVVFYFFYRYQDLYLGPKFLFDGVSVLCLLSARGLVVVFERLRELDIGAARRHVLVYSVAVAVFCVFPVVFGARLWIVREGYNDPAIVRAVFARNLHNAIVFVPSGDIPKFVACYAENSPALDGDVVYAVDRGAENEKLLALYPGRVSLRWDGERLSSLPPPQKVDRLAVRS